MVPPKPRPRTARPLTGVAAGDEDDHIARLARVLGQASGPAPAGELWIGDDAAVLGRPEGRIVLSCDAAVGGVHADLALVTLADLGWKALTAAVSDVGAMGAGPLCALASVVAPPSTDLEALAQGMAEASAEWGCPVVGGDLSAAPDVMISVAVAGVLGGDRPAVPRSGARAGDHLVVTGPLGGSAAGLRLLRSRRSGAPATPLVEAHRRPRARLVEGRVAREAGAAAMIDVSDGLGIDLHRLADASHVGFELSSVPVAEGATLDEALGGGEDYELVVATSDHHELSARFAQAGLRPPVVIGRCLEDVGIRTFDGAPLGRRGYQHHLG